MRTILHPCLLAVVLALAACGGGGSADTSLPPAPSPVLGSRAMPIAQVTVSAETAIVAGQAASVLISAPDLPAGSGVSAAVGTSYESAAAMTVTALSGNRWRATGTLPNPLPAGSSVLVTITLADGSVMESSTQDFVLKR